MCRAFKRFELRRYKLGQVVIYYATSNIAGKFGAGATHYGVGAGFMRWVLFSIGGHGGCFLIVCVKTN